MAIVEPFPRSADVDSIAMLNSPTLPSLAVRLEVICCCAAVTSPRTPASTSASTALAVARPILAWLTAASFLARRMPPVT
jgi:hypothetical protein